MLRRIREFTFNTQIDGKSIGIDKNKSKYMDVPWIWWNDCLGVYSVYYTQHTKRRMLNMVYLSDELCRYEAQLIHIIGCINSNVKLL